MARIGKAALVAAALILLGLAVGGCKEPPEGGRGGGPRLKFIVSDVDLVQAAAIALLADHFGWDVDVVVVVMHEQNLTVEDLVVLFVLLQLAKSEDAALAVGLRGQGLGWGEIAHRLGIHPGVFNQLRKRVFGPAGGPKRGKWESDEDFRQGLFIIMLSDYFAVGAPIIYEKFQKGNSLGDLTLALALGKRSGVEWTKLMEERKEKGKSWLEAAEALGTDLGELDSIAEKVKAPPEKEHPLKGQGKGKGKEAT